MRVHPHPTAFEGRGGGESWYRIAPYIYISIWAWGGDRLKNREKDRESIVSFFGEKNCCKWGGKIFFFTGEFGRFVVEILKVDLKIYHEFGRISKSFCGIFIYITSKDFFFPFSIILTSFREDSSLTIFFVSFFLLFSRVRRRCYLISPRSNERFQNRRCEARCRRFEIPRSRFRFLDFTSKIYADNVSHLEVHLF